MTDRDLRQLGALLHDIGKFAFRARPLEQGGTHEHYGGEFIRSTLVKIAAFREHVTQIADEAKRTSPAVRLADYTAAEERQTDTSQEARRLLIAIASRVQLQRDGSTPKHRCRAARGTLSQLPSHQRHRCPSTIRSHRRNGYPTTVR